LSGNHIVIDCGRGRVVFQEIKGIELISTHKALKEMEDGSICWMIVA